VGVLTLDVIHEADVELGTVQTCLVSCLRGVVIEVSLAAELSKGPDEGI
jgi:hypothetical protein